MAMIKYMPRPQKKRGNNGGRNQHIIHDSKQNKASFSRGKSIGQKFLKSNIYNKKMNCTEITMNLYTYKLNQIPGIIDEIIRCVVIDAPDIKRICFETGYGKPKKAIDIRKCASHFLTNTLGYTPNRGGAPKTFKFLNDHSNRIVIFPQDYVDYAREETERQEKAQAIIDAKNAKKQKKAAKKMKRHFVHNKWKKNLKYPAPKKKRQPIYDDEGEILDEHLFTPGGDDNENITESDDEGADSSSKEEIEETESTFLRNFTNLQVMMQESHKQGSNSKVSNKRSRSWNKHKNKKKVDIFEGVVGKKEKFEYVDPDAWRYKRKPELVYNYKQDKSASINIKKMKNGQWECEFCSFKNGKHVTICGMCFNEGFDKRSEAFMNIVTANNKKNQQRSEKKKQKQAAVTAQWDCEICTFINSNDGEVCDMCGSINVEREKYFDAQYEDYGDGFFQDAKPKQLQKKNSKQVGKLKRKNFNEEKMDMLDLEVKSCVGKKLKKMNVKKNVVVLDKNELHKNGMKSVNGQIANINREWHATVWKAHNDKQKRIEMLRRNGSGHYGVGVETVDQLPPKSVGFVPHSGKQMVGKNENNGRKKKVVNNRNNKRKQKLKQKQKQKQKRQVNGKRENVNQFKVNGNNERLNVKQKESHGRINFEWVEALVNMGFEYDQAFDAIANTNSVGFNQALDYLMQNV